LEPERHPDSLLAPQNLPYLISGLYLLGFMVPLLLPLLGFILCFVFADSRTPAWVQTHLSYHKRTFIGSVILGIVNIILFVTLLFTGAIRMSGSDDLDISASLHIFGAFGVFMLVGLLWAGWLIARCIRSILKCNDGLPMPNPQNWL
jgi:uncharacterized membrane protein